MIAGVLFDLYETLISESGLHPTRASSLAAALGLEEDAYRVEWRKRRPSIVRGESTFAGALADISKSLTGRMDAPAIDRIRQARIREKAAAYARVDASVAALVADLARQHVRLAVISNGSEEDVLGWSRCALAPRFTCAVFSCAEGVTKPDPGIYLRAVRRLNIQPGTAAYIGDGADDELLGAERAGLRAARAAWFVHDAPQKGRWPELTCPEDVLRFVAAG